VFLYSKDVTEDRPITIPIFNTYSDRFFGNELHYAFSKSSSFFFLNFYGDLFETPRKIKAPNDSSSGGSVRMAAATGAVYPINNYLSWMAGISFIVDSVYMAQSINFFIGAGLFSHYEFWNIDFGLGVLGGYYRDSYKELAISDDGYYRGNLDNKPGQIKNAARFMIVPKLGLSNKIFFLDELAANFNISKKADEFSLLSRLAFKPFQIGFAKLGINIYYDIYKYNLLLDQKLYGAKFETRYISIDIGYRQFENISNKPFASNYKNGMYGRIIGKIWPKNNIPILLSYSFEHTFGIRHFFGIGVSFAPNNTWINDLHYEFSGLENMRYIFSNYTSFE
jgi:hypothetical protein